MAPDVELRPPISTPNGRAYRGLEGTDRWLADIAESFADADRGAGVARPAHAVPIYLERLEALRLSGADKRMETQ
jgi:hypothetical protein